MGRVSCVESSLYFLICCFCHFIIWPRINLGYTSGEENECTEHLPWGWWTEGASVVDPRAACLPEMPRYVSCGQSNWFLKPETNIHLGQIFHWRKVILVCPKRWRNERRLEQSYLCTVTDVWDHCEPRDSLERQSSGGRKRTQRWCPFCAGCPRVPCSTQRPQEPSKAQVKSSP